MTDIYLEQMRDDLKEAENLLRHAIGNQHNPFADNGTVRLQHCQANVDRLHGIIRSYLNVKPNEEHEEAS